MGSSKHIGFERIYSSAVRLAATAFILDPLTLEVVVNAPALTNHGIAIVRDRLRHWGYRPGPVSPKLNEGATANEAQSAQSAIPAYRCRAV
jgi:hypothetical protein